MRVFVVLPFWVVYYSRTPGQQQRAILTANATRSVIRPRMRTLVRTRIHNVRDGKQAGRNYDLCELCVCESIEREREYVYCGCDAPRVNVKGYSRPDTPSVHGKLYIYFVYTF